MKNGNYDRYSSCSMPRSPRVEPAPIVQRNHPDFRRDLISERTRRIEKNNDYGIDDYEGDFDALVQAAAPYVSLIELLSDPATAEESQPEYRYGSFDHERDYFFYLSERRRVDTQGVLQGAAARSLWVQQAVVGARLGRVTGGGVA